MFHRKPYFHVNAYAQFQPGTGQKVNPYQPGPQSDTPEQRGGWLKQCMGRLVGKVGMGKTIAVDWELGETCDGATRKEYLRTLKEVAAANPDSYFVLVQDPRHMTANFKEQLVQTRKDAEEWARKQGAGSIERSLGLTFINEIEQTILQGGSGSPRMSTEEGISMAAVQVACQHIANQTKDRAEAVSHLCRLGRHCAAACAASKASTDESAKMPVAVRKVFQKFGQAAAGVVESNEQVDCQYREFVRRRIRNGELSQGALAEAYHAVGRCAMATDSSSTASTANISVTKTVEASGVGFAALSQGSKVVVSSEDPQHYTPTRLVDDVFYIGQDGARVPIGKNIFDGGSSVTLMGMDTFTKYEKAGCVKRAKRRSTSIS